MVVSSTTTLFQIRRQRNNTGTYYIKLLFITLLLGMLAYLASRNAVLCVLLNFTVPFALVFFQSDQFAPKGYFGYAMTFVFLELRPPTPEEFPVQMLCLLFCTLVLIGALLLYARLSAPSTPPEEEITRGLTRLAELLEELAGGGGAYGARRELEGLAQRFRRLGYARRSHFHLPDGQRRFYYLYGDNVIEKHGINRDRTGDREKTRYLCGKQGIFTRDRALIRPGFIRQLETRASTRSASFFHALGGPGRPYNGGGAAGAYRTRNGAKPLKQGHLRAKRGPLGPSRKSQQQTKRTGFAAHGHSIAETAPEGKRASRANGALNRAKINGRGQKQGFGGVDRRRGSVTSCYSRRYGGDDDRAQARQNGPFAKGHFRQSRGDVSLCPYFLGFRGVRAVLGQPKQRDRILI